MTARTNVIIGPWPGSGTTVQYSAECVKHAREIERMFREMEEAERFRNAVSTMHGFYADTIPSDVEVK